MLIKKGLYCTVSMFQERFRRSIVTIEGSNVVCKTAEVKDTQDSRPVSESVNPSSIRGNGSLDA